MRVFGDLVEDEIHFLLAAVDVNGQFLEQLEADHRHIADRQAAVGLRPGPQMRRMHMGNRRHIGVLLEQLQVTPAAGAALALVDRAVKTDDGGGDFFVGVERAWVIDGDQFFFARNALDKTDRALGGGGSGFTEHAEG